jgi:hypothetical protein
MIRYYNSLVSLLWSLYSLCSMYTLLSFHIALMSDHDTIYCATENVPLDSDIIRLCVYISSGFDSVDASGYTTTTL